VAAKASFVSQPSLSQAISELESELKLKLLDRNSRRVELTSAGKSFCEDAMVIIQSVDEAILKARRIASGMDGEFKIGTLGGLARSAFLTTVTNFKKRHETVDIKITQTNVNELNRALLKGDLDVALTREYNTAHYEQDLDWVPLWQDRFGIVLRKDHPLAQCESPDLSDFGNESFIFLDKNTSPNTYSFAYKICTSRELEPHVMHTASTLEIACTMLKAGMGVAVLPECALVYSVNDLRFIPVEGEDTYSAVVMAWRRQNMSPIVPLFLEEFDIEDTGTM